MENGSCRFALRVRLHVEVGTDDTKQWCQHFGAVTIKQPAFSWKSYSSTKPPQLISVPITSTIT